MKQNLPGAQQFPGSAGSNFCGALAFNDRPGGGKAGGAAARSQDGRVTINKRGSEKRMVAFNESIEWSSKLRKQAGPKVAPESFRVGPVEVHPRTGRVRSAAGEFQLRPKELELLLHLYAHARVTFTRQELLRRVWDYHADLFTRTVDQTMATLRKKIEPDPERPRFLQTVYRNGYRLVL